MKRQICKTSTLPRPHQYVIALEGEYRHIAFSEERAPANKGKWRELVFGEKNSDRPMDLEIGTGNGFHFAHRAESDRSRLIVGIELKYKPLIQAIRRAQMCGYKNSAIARYHAFHTDELFLEGEINNVYIHFPDPWTTPNKPKNRVVNKEVLEMLYRLQRPGTFLEFKTDSREYFLWAMEEIKQTPYVQGEFTMNLHQSEFSATNFITGFEKIFLQKGIEINYVKLYKH